MSACDLRRPESPSTARFESLRPYGRLTLPLEQIGRFVLELSAMGKVTAAYHYSIYLTQSMGKVTTASHYSIYLTQSKTAPLKFE